MTKYDVEFKIKIARQGARGTVGLTELARRCGVDYSTVRGWVAMYVRHGRAGIEKKCEVYDEALKRRVLQEIREGRWSLRKATVVFNLRSTSTIRRWQRQYDQGTLAPVNERRAPVRIKKEPPVPKPDNELTREELLEEVAYLRAETAYLKKLDALILQEKAAVRGKKRKPSKG